jgi:hypothetical protein
MAKASSTGTFPRADQAILRFSERVDSMRQDIYYCDVAALSTRARKDVIFNVRAAAYVWLAAALESAVKDLLAAVLDHINAANVAVQELRLSLFALVNASELDSLQQVRGLKMWQHRASLFGKTQDVSVCNLRLNALPLDGRTIRIEHLETIWHVFGFEGEPLPTPFHKLALRDLSDTRNELAHGEEDIEPVAGRKSTQDLLQLIERVEEIALHLWGAIYEYLKQDAYRRRP